jgi:hypothetical protein
VSCRLQRNPNLQKLDLYHVVTTRYGPLTDALAVALGPETRCVLSHFGLELIEPLPASVADLSTFKRSLVLPDVTASVAMCMTPALMVLL